MGKVATTFKLMPESPEVDLEKVQADIKEKLDCVKDMKLEPIAFGLNALLVMVVTEDSEGGMDEIENTLTSIEGVSDLEALSSTLL
ncbi:MAG: elongation factor 1-beta [Candidatus Aenigmarchaeota archaeon]|nr:elongation factor 1-beta [Candidatus Aenigmarchaeota archaeon]